MKAVLDVGYEEPVPEKPTATKNKIGYIPHHPVVNSKKPEKVRIVYDCAALVGTKSLNDFLMKGPDLTNALIAVLFRFRKWLVPVIADVEVMFYQVRVSPSDKDAQRYYWWPNDDIDNNPIVYRTTVHLFGAKSSPSCATFCLRQIARQFGKHFDPVIAETVLKSFYIDDCLAGAESEEAAIDLVNSIQALLAMGRFKLTKWLSSSIIVMKSIPEEKSTTVKSAQPSTALQQRVLGISWNVTTDEFFFTTEMPNCRATVTKQNILSVTNSFCDPMGFVGPVVLQARLIYSEVCREKFSWDEPINGVYAKRWKSMVNGLKHLHEIKIPRCYKPKADISIPYQLHFFSDASNAARGTVCPLRLIFPDKIVSCAFITGKSYTNGPGRNKIPRLKLQAALDSVKLSRMVKQELELFDCQSFFWTDSLIVLYRLHADRKHFSFFTRNRLQRILRPTKVYD